MLNPKRQYYKSHGTMRRIKIPMRPPVRCVIVDCDDVHVAYFPSRTKAKKALWHLLNDPESLKRAPYEIVRMK